MHLEELYRCPPHLFEPNPHWKIFLASKRGRSHIATGKVCQDYCLAEKITEELFVTAAADGHGGDDYVKSDVGAKEACNSVVALAKKYSRLDSINFLNKWRSPEFKAELFDRWQAAVIKDYRAENPDTKEADAKIIRKYGTTLLFCVVTKSHFILGQIGDGAILLFNDQNRSQLFKRHNPKFDSKTASLASRNGRYSLLVDSYRRFNSVFNKILLSTDGIYDKLDRGTSFARYANELAEQIRGKRVEEIEPFTVAGIDVSEKSSDDCTIVTIVSPPTKEKECALLQDEAGGLDELKFERAYNRLEIYSAVKDGVPIELHVSKYLYDDNYSFDESGDKIKLLKPAPKNFHDNINVFNVPEGPFRVRELIEHGEHLEKKYISADEEPPRFSNEFWLNFYETILELKNFCADKKYFAEENFFNTMMISERGEIFLFADCLSKALFNDASSRKYFETFESHFGFLGKIKCAEKILPLFKCSKYYAGQIVPELHGDARENFCRVVYNPKAKAYGLQNLSAKIWFVEDKEVKPNQYLTLTGNKTFELSEDIRYEITLFATE